MQVDKTVQVAVCVMADGSISFTLPDHASINSVTRDWLYDLGKSERERYAEAQTKGGVVVITMFSEDYNMLTKKVRHDRAN